MEKKKLKLSITGTSKKTINSIEQAKSHPKNSVVIEKRAGKCPRKPNFNNNKNHYFTTLQIFDTQKSFDISLLSYLNMIFTIFKFLLFFCYYLFNNFFVLNPS